MAHQKARTERLRVITDTNVDGICNVMRKPGDKNTDETPNGDNRF